MALSPSAALAKPVPMERSWTNGPNALEFLCVPDFRPVPTCLGDNCSGTLRVVAFQHSAENCSRLYSDKILDCTCFVLKPPSWDCQTIQYLNFLTPYNCWNVATWTPGKARSVLGWRFCTVFTCWMFFFKEAFRNVTVQICFSRAQWGQYPPETWQKESLMYFKYIFFYVIHKCLG